MCCLCFLSVSFYTCNLNFFYIYDLLSDLTSDLCFGNHIHYRSKIWVGKGFLESLLFSPSLYLFGQKFCKKCSNFLNITIYNNRFLIEYILKCNLFLWGTD